MDFNVYLSKYVKVDIFSSGYYYEGKIIDVDDNFLRMIDKNNNNVTISINDIKNIREVENVKQC